MSYVAQLLPDLQQARILRNLLDDYTRRDDISEDDRDAAFELLIKLTRDMRKDRSWNSTR